MYDWEREKVHGITCNKHIAVWLNWPNEYLFACYHFLVCRSDKNNSPPPQPFSMDCAINMENGLVKTEHRKSSIVQTTLMEITEGTNLSWLAIQIILLDISSKDIVFFYTKILYSFRFVSFEDANIYIILRCAWFFFLRGGSFRKMNKNVLNKIMLSLVVECRKKTVKWSYLTGYFL